MPSVRAGEAVRSISKIEVPAAHSLTKPPAQTKVWWLFAIECGVIG